MYPLSISLKNIYMYITDSTYFIFAYLMGFVVLLEMYKTLKSLNTREIDDSQKKILN